MLNKIKQIQTAVAYTKSENLRAINIKHPKSYKSKNIKCEGIIRHRIKMVKQRQCEQLTVNS